MEKIALITGITGQDGSYLAELLLEKGYAVHGIVRRTSNLLRSRIEHLRNDESVYDKSLFLHYGDLSDVTTLRRIFSDVQPAEIYHLAGQSHVGLSFDIPESTCEEIGMATLRLLEIARDQARLVKFYHASSSEIFGNATESPQTENTPLRPASPYGCAKAFATSWRASIANPTTCLFATGSSTITNRPGARPGIVAGKSGKPAGLGTGAGLCRGDVADAATGGAGRLCRRGWRNSFRSRFVERAFAVVNLPPEKYVKHNPAFDRPADPVRLVGSPAKIKAELGWRPSGSFDDLVREMVEAELAAIDAQADTD
jgi:GDPmannose 4,6-dehydratase